MISPGSLKKYELTDAFHKNEALIRDAKAKSIAKLKGTAPI